MTVATEAWLNQIKKIVVDGKKCNDTLEILSSSLSFDMKYPIVKQKGRKLSYPFMFAEALYIITGQSDVRQLEKHVSKFQDYSDLYPFQQGAYGPMFIEQIRYVVETLRVDPTSRRAVMTIWRQNPRYSVDFPCTLSLQFLIRDEYLHCVVNMRSSDVFTGLAYDMFCFSVMAAAIKCFLSESIKMGNCYINAGSSHLYDKDHPRLLEMEMDHRQIVEELVYPSTYSGIAFWLSELAEGRIKL